MRETKTATWTETASTEKEAAIPMHRTLNATGISHWKVLTDETKHIDTKGFAALNEIADSF